jgi:hypothetical protein
MLKRFCILLAKPFLRYKFYKKNTIGIILKANIINAFGVFALKYNVQMW